MRVFIAVTGNPRSSGTARARYLTHDNTAGQCFFFWGLSVGFMQRMQWKVLLEYMSGELWESKEKDYKDLNF